MRALALVLTGALAAASSAAAGTPRAIAVHPLQPLATEQQIVDRLEELLRAEVGRLPDVQLQPREQTLAALPQADETDAGCFTVACLSRVGKAGKVDQLIFGTVATLGDSYVLDLKLISVANQKEIRRESTNLSGDQAVLIEGVRGLATQLVAPELYVGSLELRLEKPGAEVYVDGTLVGTTPLAAIGGITPGKHALKIVLTGYRDFDRFVEVRHDRTTIVNVALSGDTIDATIEAKAGAPAPQESPVLVVTELPEETKPIPAEEPSPFESPLFLASLGVGGAGLLLAAAGVGSVVYEATAFQAELGAEHVELGGQVDGRDVYVIKQGAEHVDGYDEAMEENYSIAEGLWYGGWVAFGIGLATLATGAALLAWDLTDTPAPTEATPAGAEATATPQ